MSKILFFHSHTSRGGTEQNIVKISRALSQKGYEVSFCCFENTSDLYDDVKDFGSQTAFLGNPKSSPLQVIKNYKSFLKSVSPDVVLSFGLRVEMVARLFTPRSIRLISNIRSTDAWRKWHHTFLDKMTQSKVNSWVSNSKAGADAFIEREGIDPKKTKVIYNFIENRKADEKLLDVISTLKIGILANIRPAKGHDILIPLAKELKRKGIKFKLILAGKDMMGGKLFREITEASLDDFFEHRGFVKEIDKFLDEIDISLLPSRWEGLPTSILEAMSHGVPVVATDVGGVSEIIDTDIDGKIVTVDDVGSMSGAIVSLTDKQHYASISRGAIAKIKSKFSKEIIIKEWVSALQN